MTTLPRLYGPLPGAPRTETAVYFERNTAFGAPHARPAETPPAAEDFGDDSPPVQLDLAVGSGPVPGGRLAQQLSAVQGVAHQLQAELATARRALRAERELRDAAEFARDMANHRCEQLTDEADQLRAQCAAMRDDVAATTVDAVRIALDRAARAITGRSAAELAAEIDATDDLFDDSDAETVVVDTELLGGAP